MTITIYELLGLIKDGKAPKKIKYENFYCYYDEEKNEYVDYAGVPFFKWNHVVMNSLNNTVEILEEENKIEKLENGKWHIEGKDGKLIMLKDKIDELIDEINSIKENK